MIPDDDLNIWLQTRDSLYPLYARRAIGGETEMDCQAQAAEIYAPYFSPGDRILDAAGGSGYFYWSLKKRALLGDYHLLDYNRDFLDMGREALSEELDSSKFIHASIQELSGEYEAVFCLNALFCLPDYRQGLERLLKAAVKIIIIRTTLAESRLIRYETDKFLDKTARGLKSYFNIWPLAEMADFMHSHGFSVESPVDRRTGDKPEISAGKEFPWRWLVGIKTV